MCESRDRNRVRARLRAAAMHLDEHARTESCRASLVLFFWLVNASYYHYD